MCQGFPGRQSHGPAANLAIEQGGKAINRAPRLRKMIEQTGEVCFYGSL